MKEKASQISIERGGMVITDSGDPADRVADFIPRTFLGRTDRGPVTCVDAYLQPWSGKFTDFLTSPLRQVWDAQMLIIGAHLPEGRHTELGAVRFGLGPPGGATCPMKSPYPANSGRFDASGTRTGRWYSTSNLQSP